MSLLVLWRELLSLLLLLVLGAGFLEFFLLSMGGLSVSLTLLDRSWGRHTYSALLHRRQHR